MTGTAAAGPFVAGTGLPATADAVVIGAGMVGAATAARLAAAGRRVCVLDRRGPLGGTTAAGEGNILVSDKPPGPELALALRSAALWREFAATGGPGFEYDPKGGVVVARDAAELAGLHELGTGQRAAGAAVTTLDEAGLHAAEPQLARGLAGGAFYPQDAQVQPMLAAMALLNRAGVAPVVRAEVTGLTAGPVPVLHTDRGRIATPVIINAAGPWAGEVARRLGTDLPVRPRRGHILVTEPLPWLVVHKVYECGYLGTVVTDSTAPACSAVVEGTASGTILVGSSRDFSASPLPDARILAEIARRAVALFPFLGQVRAIRAYTGFRPAGADHLPVIGPDPVVAGLWHAAGHEGAGIGLAPATAELLTALLDGQPPPVDPAPFAPARFASVPGAAS